MRKGFWGKFDELMDALPGYIDSQIEEASGDGKGWFTSKSVSTSTTITNGKKVEVKTVNGKTTIKVNGKEYVEKVK